MRPADLLPPLSDLPRRAEEASAAVDRLCERACFQLALRATSGGVLSPEALEHHQRAAHGLAWLATYAAALRCLAAHAARLDASGRLGELEHLLITAAFGEYVSQIAGGIPMNQAEFIRPADLGLNSSDLAILQERSPAGFIAANTQELRHRIVALIAQTATPTFGDCGLDETLDEMRATMRRFSDSEVTPYAHDWHRRNLYVPMELIGALSRLGVFALTLPESYGGMGLGKVAMCVVSEELSRGWIAVGSLGTRAEIAAELILAGGTERQKQRWLPRIASGESLPAAVFTEPDTGSDLAALKTRALRNGDHYLITGNKTWITHPVRADIMTILARTDLNEPGHQGLSMFIAEKPRGDDRTPFPVAGLTGSEIEVLGYRGMKEYELRFDNFAVAEDSLLGGVEGTGFRQLMQTFESARIQTAARAIGVAHNAFDLGLRYARERTQFAKPIIAFPRIAGKLAMMAVEIFAARQLTYYAAREKDAGRRCDLEAGMAKLLAARVAWSAADNSVQIHGGNGFALEYPISRVLCDARILSIFEGSAEIQAQVIARRLLERGN
ncbi:MAG: acyl-CoA dehydrogenase family protein [Aestuariivirgaceae bacterium]